MFKSLKLQYYILINLMLQCSLVHSTSYRCKISIHKINDHHQIIMIYETQDKLDEYLSNITFKFIEVDDPQTCMLWKKFQQPVDQQLYIPIIKNNSCSKTIKNMNINACIEKSKSYRCYFGSPIKSVINFVEPYETIKNSVTELENDVILKFDSVDIEHNPAFSSAFKFSFVTTILIFSFIVLQIIAWFMFIYIPKPFVARFLGFIKGIVKYGYLNSNKIHIATDKESTDACSICLEVFVYGDILRSTKCNHLFHKKCVDPWLLSNNTCPLCKKDIMETIELSAPTIFNRQSNLQQNNYFAETSEFNQSRLTSLTQLNEMFRSTERYLSNIAISARQLLETIMMPLKPNSDSIDLQILNIS